MTANDLADNLEHGYPSAERKQAAAMLRSQEAKIERLRGILRLQQGHAKGHYMNKCIRCETVMEWVDKRCFICVECADAAIAALEQKT